MSVSIATLGMFSRCRGVAPEGGGAVLTREVEEIKPRILVTKIESEDRKEKLSIDITDIK